MLLDKINLPGDLRQLSTLELQGLADEVRQLLIDIVPKTGGHLAPSLGVVELTVALHAALNSPIDKIIWDVGHQAYAHKILTGRKDQFGTLRQYHGISGFPKREESVHDHFGVGHASTSISAALGIAKARDLRGDDYAVAVVIGDGSLSGGLAFEAMNNCHKTRNFVVVINDNDMAISRPVGAFAQVMTSLRTTNTYQDIRKKIETIFDRIPNYGEPLLKRVERLVERTRDLVLAQKMGVIFEEFGFQYLGPLDGYNLPMLIAAINFAKKSDRPTVIHVLTKKGQGYQPAEDDPEHFHGIAKNSHVVSVAPTEQTYTQIFGSTICKLAIEHKELVAITAAMPAGTGLQEFANLFPTRFFDVGIAEEHAVTFAAGMATQGIRPIVAIYSTFLQRSYDQIIHDVCLQNLPVIFAIDRAGLVGEDGATHHGVFDIGFLRNIPNLTLMVPGTGEELIMMMEYAVTNISGPVAIRYPRGYVPNHDLVIAPIEHSKGCIVIEGNQEINKVAIIAIGSMLWPAIKVSQQLEKTGHSCRVINARFVKPLDQQLIIQAFEDCALMVTIEEGQTAGGFGSAILELLSGKEMPLNKIMTIGIPDQFVSHGATTDLMAEIQLDPDNIVEKIICRLR